ncbi:MAG: PorT family protein [Bacteroidales bacterium]|nr:PorT family protein [Bacteroidales bacterium]
MNINEWYKKIVDSGTEAPPEAIWDGVQDQLDVDAVWTRLDASLSSHARKKRIAAFAVAATLFLTVSTLGLWYFLSPSGIDESKQAALYVSETEESEVDTGAATKPEDEGFTAEAENGIPPARTDIEIPAREVIQYAQISPLKDVQPGEASFEEEVTRSQPLPLLAAHMQLDADQSNSLNFRSSFAGKDDFLSFRVNEIRADNLLSSVYIGFTGQLANTWMLNDKTFTGLKSDELTFTDPSFGSNLGMQIGAGLTQRLGLRAEIMLLNRNRQIYREYINGNFVTNDITLDYYSLKLMARFNAGNHARPHYFLAGAYTGFMQQATQTINGISRYVDNEYENLDYGLIFGYEYPFPLTGHLTFTPGLFAQMGLNNVFSGNERMPDFLNRTHNASLNLSFAISYSFY